MAEEAGAYKLLTKLPVLYLILRAGAGYKVFSRAFGEKGNGAAGT